MGGVPAETGDWHGGQRSGWYGSHPKPHIGGVFEIIINSKTGRIVKVTHGE